MPQSYRFPPLGYVSLWKLGGNASALSTGTQINIPCVHIVPLNPDNNSYPGLVATTAYPSQRVKGMRTPSVSITACYKPSWCSANLFNSLINTGTDIKANQTDRFAIGIKDDIGTVRIWDWARCERLQFQQNVMGGPIMVTMDFKCRFGDSEAPYGTNDPATGSSYGSAPAFSTPGSVDAGELYGEANTAITGLGSVRSYTLTLMRGQAYVSYFSSSLYSSEIGTTMFSGGLSLDQDPGGTTITSSGTGTIQIGPSSTTGSVLASFSVVRDDHTYPLDVGIGNMSLRYSLVDLTNGGNPCAFTAA